MPSLAPGTLLGGRYLLERPIAEGGMGAVWRAQHVKLDIAVAVKTMSPALAASDGARARFEREAKAAARLSSPHVVEVHDYGVDAESPYIVMEYLEGQDLAARIEQSGRLAIDETADVVEQIARALEMAHAAGVVHRDLKPGNVFLARKGQDEIVKVLDFGIAKLREENDESGTIPGMLVGSPSYMSPEQARGERTLDHRSDLWSLGVVTFQCLTGRLPFFERDVARTILAIFGTGIPVPSKHVDGLPEEVDRFFVRAFARPLQERFQSASELAEALREACELEPRPRWSGSVRPPPATPRPLVPSARGVAIHESKRARESPPTTPIEGRGVGRAAQAVGAVIVHSSQAAALLASARETIAGRFEVLELAGEGGMGVVYRAIDKLTGAPVALKLLRDATLDSEMFFREARVLTEVRHPGVVRYVAHGSTAEGRLYLAMEWLEGGDLARRLRTGPLDLAEGLALVGRVAEALGAAHRHGVVHGDLKPSNVLLAGGAISGAKVIDFGIARLVHRARAAVPRTSVVIGTPGYMPPEQARGDADVDARADVFALGCLLFECLTGRPPFPAETPLASLAKVVSEPTPRAREIAPNVPTVVDHLLARLLAKAREERPTDGSEVAGLITAMGRPSTARSKESITTSERKLLPVVLVVPTRAATRLAGAGLRLASEVRSEDATWVASSEAVAMAGRLAPIARRFQARPQELHGGALAVVFESAGALADRATQAALCALSLRAAEPDAAIAIATGRRGATGDVLERAAVSISRAADLSGIVLDDTTFGLLDGHFAIERTASGYAMRGRLRTDDAQRLVLGKATPCAGREPELGMLEALYRECVEEAQAKAVIVKGAAGAGKSRVRQEFLRRVAQRGGELRVWMGRGDVMNAGSPFAMLSHALLSMLDLAGGEPDDARRARLRERVAEHVAAKDVERVAAFLGDMIGIPHAEVVSPEVAAAREDALLLGDQRRRAFEDFLAATLSAGPVVLVLEDLHLGDLPTVKLVDGALRALADRPLFVLATARPEIDDLFPKIWEERVPQEIRVGPLSAKASEKIVRHVLGARAAADLVARIVARAAGHPLYLEEIVRAVSEREGGELPDTVLAMVEARIAALDPGARRVLRAASVYGRTFWEGAVAALTPLSASDVRDWLCDLADREWLTRAPLSRFGGEAEYAIAQDLVQEAAYAMLPDEDRALGHAAAGEWLVGAGERDATVLARHFSLGGDRAEASGWMLRAAEQALDGNDFESAVRNAERAAELDDAPQRKGRACAIAAEAHLHRGEIEAAARRGTEAMQSLLAGDAGYFRACAVVAVASGKLGDLRALGEVARMLLAIEPAAGALSPFAMAASHATVQLVIGGERAQADTLYGKLGAIVRAAADAEPLALAYVARAAGARAAFSGDLFGSIVHLRETAAAFDAAGDLRSACSARKTLGWYLGECGALEEAERALREAIVTAERMGLTNLAPHAKHDLGSPLLRLGKLDEARRSQEEAVAAFQAQGDRRLESGARAMLSAIATQAGRFEDAEREARAAIDVAPSAPIRFTALARLAEARHAAGRYDEAVSAADEALALIADTGTSEECLVVCLLARAESLAALGRAEDARAALARAHTEIETRAAQIRDAELRRTFIERIPENARVAELLGAKGSQRARQ